MTSTRTSDSGTLITRSSWLGYACRLLLVVSLAFSVACSGCTDDDNDGSSDTGGEIDATADTGLDSSDTGTKDSASDTDPADTSRPTDTDNEWDFGTPDSNDQELSLQAVVPSSGPVPGGNIIRIRGTGLSGDLTVYVGSREMDVELSSGQLIGRAPPSTGPGTVTVKAIAVDGEVASLPDSYEYIEGLVVDDVTPDQLPTSGGVQVDVRGAGFTPQAAVSFSGTPALRTDFVNPELLRVLTPPRSKGYADVRVTTASESTVLERGVQYYEPLEITDVIPSSGATSGGENVVVEGEGFDSQTTFEFGGNSASVSSIDSRNGTATVQTPPHAAGLVDVTASNARDDTILSDAFLYRTDDSPDLAAVRPGIGPAAGGTAVTLVGYGFDDPNLRITFGGADATIVDASADHAVVETPAGTPGAVDVTMYSGSTELDRLVDGFEYREDVWIDGLSPESGPVEGGTTVTVTGEGFQNAQRVVFGGIPAEFSVVSDTEIEATTPAHGAGAVDVVVEANGLEARLQDGFTFTESLEIWGFSPVRGSVAGGTYMEMRGRGFYGELQVTFDAEQAPTVQRVDRNNLILYTPPHAVGEAKVSLTDGSRQAEAPYTYQYFNPASRFGGASGGAVDGSVNVSVFSSGGGPIENAFVMLSTRSDTPYTGTTDANGQITLSGPDVLGPQTVTATAADYSSASVQRVDAQNITIFLNQLDPNPGGGQGQETPFGTISGTVTTPGKLADPTKETTFDMARVATTRPGPFTGTIDPGDGGTVIGDGEYNIRSRVGDVAVVAVCGVYDESNDSFHPQYIGVERFLFVSDEGSYDVDITCDIPLDQTADVKLVNPVYAPDGPNTNRVRVFWDFGFEGVFESPVAGRGLTNIISIDRQPKAEGVLSDMKYSFIGGSFTGQYAPFTQTWVQDVENIDQTIVLPPLLDVPEAVTPQPGNPLENRTIQFEAAGPHYPDLYRVQLINTEGIPFWQFVIPGDANTVRVPEFPDFSFLPPDQRPAPFDSPQVYMTIIGIRGDGIRLDDFSYRDLSFDAWSAYSLTRWSFQIPQEMRD